MIGSECKREKIQEKKIMKTKKGYDEWWKYMKGLISLEHGTLHMWLTGSW